MKKYSFNDLSIKTKLLLFFSLVIFTTIFILIFPIYNKFFSILKQNAQNQAYETISQTATSIHYNLKSTEEIANSIAYSSDIQELLSKPITSINFTSLKNKALPLSYYSKAERAMIINYSSLLYDSIEVYGNNGMEFNVPNRFNENSPAEINGYINTAKKYSGAAQWMPATSEDDYYQLVKEIRDLTTTKSLGVIHIELKHQYLDSLLENVNLGGRGYTVILDSTGSYLAGQKLTQEQNLQLHQYSISNTTSSTISFGTKRYLMVQSTLPEQGLELYGIIPIKALYTNLDQLRNWLFALICLCCLVVFLISIHLSHNIVKPLEQMTYSMDAAAHGDFTQILPVNRKDEVGRLSENFNIMIGKINALIDNVYKKELLQKEAQFKMLQAQINPHFLYNALDTINWTAQLNHMNQISHLVTALSNLMRISINNKKKTVSVAEEIHCIKDYLYIQKTRYQDKVSAMIDISQELYTL